MAGDQEKLRTVGIYLGVAFLLYLLYYWLIPALKGLFGFVLPLVLPFVLAIVIAAILEPIISWIQKRTSINRSFAVLLVMGLTLGSLIVGITVLVSRLAVELTSLSKNIPNYSSNIYSFVDQLWTGTQDWYLSFDFPLQLRERLETVVNHLLSLLQTGADVGTKGLLDFLVALPGGFLVVIFTLLAMYFLLRDWKKFGEWFVGLFPVSRRQPLRDVARTTAAAITGYLWATVILAIITTVETLVGLFILRVNYAWLFAVVVGLADILPVVGPGAVFIPWILWELATGNFGMMLALAILYGIITVVRQVLQPKIVGDNVGLHPIEALVALYIGLKAMGVLGVLLGPIIWVIVKSAWVAGLFHGGVKR